METNKTKIQEYEKDIERLNQWISDNPDKEQTDFYRLTVHDRDYYVKQLCKLTENE